jgi:hypothetical protein
VRLSIVDPLTSGTSSEHNKDTPCVAYTPSIEGMKFGNSGRRHLCL